MSCGQRGNHIKEGAVEKFSNIAWGGRFYSKRLVSCFSPHLKSATPLLSILGTGHIIGIKQIDGHVVHKRTSGGKAVGRQKGAFGRREGGEGSDK